jgi:flagellar protein FlbD
VSRYIQNMIKLTRLNRVPLIVNADLIEHVEGAADTVVALTNGQKFLVLESAEEIIDKVLEFRRAIMAGANCPMKSAPQSAPQSDGAMLAR